MQLNLPAVTGVFTEEETIKTPDVKSLIQQEFNYLVNLLPTWHEVSALFNLLPKKQKTFKQLKISFDVDENIINVPYSKDFHEFLLDYITDLDDTLLIENYYKIYGLVEEEFNKKNKKRKKLMPTWLLKILPWFLWILAGLLLSLITKLLKKIKFSFPKFSWPNLNIKFLLKDLFNSLFQFPPTFGIGRVLLPQGPLPLPLPLAPLAKKIPQASFILSNLFAGLWGAPAAINKIEQYYTPVRVLTHEEQVKNTVNYVEKTLAPQLLTAFPNWQSLINTTDLLKAFANKTLNANWLSENLWNQKVLNIKKEITDKGTELATQFKEAKGKSLTETAQLLKTFIDAKATEINAEKTKLETALNVQRTNWNQTDLNTVANETVKEIVQHATVNLKQQTEEYIKHQETHLNKDVVDKISQLSSQMSEKLKTIAPNTQLTKATEAIAKYYEQQKEHLNSQSQSKITTQLNTFKEELTKKVEAQQEAIKNITSLDQLTTHLETANKTFNEEAKKLETEQLKALNTQLEAQKQEINKTLIPEVAKAVYNKEVTTLISEAKLETNEVPGIKELFTTSTTVETANKVVNSLEKVRSKREALKKQIFDNNSLYQHCNGGGWVWSVLRHISTVGACAGFTVAANVHAAKAGVNVDVQSLLFMAKLAVGVAAIPLAVAAAPMMVSLGTTIGSSIGSTLTAVSLGGSQSALIGIGSTAAVAALGSATYFTI